MTAVNGVPELNGDLGETPAVESPILAANGKFADLLKTLSELQALDTKHELDLPQLVVCGEQSVGKSSVLEAISNVPFPRANAKCTKFVTR